MQNEIVDSASTESGVGAKTTVWRDISSAPMPTNLRILVCGHNEMCMAWLDVINQQLYFAPQGGIVPFKVTHWMDLPEPPDLKLRTAANHNVQDE